MLLGSRKVCTTARTRGKSKAYKIKMERLRESQKKEPYEETLTNEKPRDKTTTAPEDLLEMALVSQYEQEAKKLVEYFEQYTLCKGRLEMIRKVAAVQGIHLPEAYGL